MSQLMPMVRVRKITTEEDTALALRVIRQVYLDEKQWISSLDNQIDPSGKAEKISWFLATCADEPVGLLRLVYDPQLQLPAEYEVTLNNGVDLSQLSQQGRFVEIGRFMTLPAYRKNMVVALRLMRAAIREVVEQGYTHFITDVFENERHSPYEFHTRVLGFEVIGRHLYGDLQCSCTRIILTLDILAAFKRLKERRSRLYRTLVEGIGPLVDKRLKAKGTA